MKMVKKIFYSNAERVERLTSEAARKMERQNTFRNELACGIRIISN